MQPSLRILFLDDETTFLESTSELLRCAGYECDAAQDIQHAHRLFDSHRYDLVIADVNMPGNVNLEFVSNLAERSDGLPVILVTGYPSIASAIHSVELPVVAYMVKPFEFGDLLEKVQATAQRAVALRAVRDELARLREYRQGLLHTEECMQKPSSFPANAATRAFIGLAMRNVVDSLVALRVIAKDVSAEGVETELHHWQIAESAEMREAIRDAVATLERTKTSFKSKELGELRRKLESLLAQR